MVEILHDLIQTSYAEGINNLVVKYICIYVYNGMQDFFHQDYYVLGVPILSVLGPLGLERAASRRAGP